MNLKSFKYFLVLSLAFFVFTGVASAATCDFSRTLKDGEEGEDVRCLQQYLNNSGYVVSTSGVGSPGNETDTYAERTQSAVTRWQEANGLSADGIFGPRSIAKYKELLGSGVSSPQTPSSGERMYPESVIAALNNRISSLQERLASGEGEVTGDEAKAQERIKEAVDMMDQARDEIEDYSGNTSRAEEELDDARDDLMRSILLYFQSDFTRSYDFAGYAYDNAEEAFEDAGGETKEDELEERLEDLDDDFDRAEEKIDDARDDREDTDLAEELLEEARDKLRDAEDALDDEDYDLADDLADDAEELIEDAVDAIGENEQRDDADDAIEDAEDAIRYAEDEIEEADDDRRDVRDAEDLLDEAKELLEEAEDEFDDKDYDRAEELAEDAEDKADDAVDAID